MKKGFFIALLTVITSIAYGQPKLSFKKYLTFSIPRLFLKTSCMNDSSFFYCDSMGGTPVLFSINVYSRKRDSVQNVNFPVNNGIAFATDSLLYLGGGVSVGNTTSKAFYKYNIHNRAIVRLGDLPFSYVNRPEILFTSNGRILALLMEAQDGREDLNLFEYDVKDDSWSFINSFDYKDTSPTACMKGDDAMYIRLQHAYMSLNGSLSFLLYSLKGDSTKQLPDFIGKPRVGGLCFSLNDHVYYGTGLDISKNEPIEHSGIFNFDTDKGQWLPTNSLPMSMHFCHKYSTRKGLFIGVGISSGSNETYLWQVKEY